MKLSLLKLAALTFLLGCVPAYSQTLNWGSLDDSTIVDSNGEDLGQNNTFLFELGAFDEDFIPDETNVGQWGAKWHTFDTASLTTDEYGSRFLDTRVLQNDAPGVQLDYVNMFEGLKGYIMIRNPERTEYFLARFDTWVFPTFETNCCSNDGTLTWTVSESTTPIFGSVGNNHGGGDFESPGPYDIQTHTVTGLQPIPETHSSLLAILGCGAALMRRRRLKCL